MPSKEEVKKHDRAFALEIERDRKAVKKLLGPNFDWDEWPLPPSLWFDDDGDPKRRKR